MNMQKVNRKNGRAVIYVLLLALMLIFPALACTLVLDEEDTSATDNGRRSPRVSATATFAAVSVAVDEAFIVEVLAPETSQSIPLGQRVDVRVHVENEEGVERIQMDVIDERGQRLTPPISKSLPPDSTSSDAILRWFPADSGIYTLEVRAFRRQETSPPATLTLLILSSADVAATETITSLAALNVTATAGANATATAAAMRFCAATIEISNLHRREGPGTAFVTRGFFLLGETVDVLGQSTDGKWLKVVQRSRGDIFWANNNPNWVRLDAGTGCQNLPRTQP